MPTPPQYLRARLWNGKLNTHLGSVIQEMQRPTLSWYRSCVSHLHCRIPPAPSHHFHAATSLLEVIKAIDKADAEKTVLDQIGLRGKVSAAAFLLEGLRIEQAL